MWWPVRAADRILAATLALRRTCAKIVSGYAESVQRFAFACGIALRAGHGIVARTPRSIQPQGVSVPSLAMLPARYTVAPSSGQSLRAISLVMGVPTGGLGTSVPRRLFPRRPDSATRLARLTASASRSVPSKTGSLAAFVKSPIRMLSVRKVLAASGIPVESSRHSKDQQQSGKGELGPHDGDLSYQKSAAAPCGRSMSLLPRMRRDRMSSGSG